MRITYLVFKDADIVKKELVVATATEWKKIMNDNRTLPKEQRRYFIKDCICDGGDPDYMYIETTKEEFDKWHSRHEYDSEKRNYKNQFAFVSLSEDRSEDVKYTLEDVLDDGFNVEKEVISEIMLQELRKALAKWREWGVEMLDYYLNNQKFSCSKELVAKYGVSYKTVAKWKERFEEFVVNFLR